VERDRLASLAGFFRGGVPLSSGTVANLGAEAAHHARVRRLEVGDRVYLADGAGRQGNGVIESLSKKQISISIEDVAYSPRSPAVHLLVPVADRDRMLWCAEKCAELGATSWCAVMWQRSRSVSPRGEGDAFRQRLRARMQSALIQAHAPWLPAICDAEPSLDPALAGVPGGGSRLVLDAAGEPIGRVSFGAPVTIAVGPEGGLESDELQALRDARFHPVSLGANVLRFETAVLAALAIVRSTLGTSSETIDG
jgi:16S rRNA (uracil1498-N3)-methyltransferase